jgi:hypothetical protein
MAIDMGMNDEKFFAALDAAVRLYGEALMQRNEQGPEYVVKAANAVELPAEITKTENKTLCDPIVEAITVCFYNESPGITSEVIAEVRAAALLHYRAMKK